MEPYQGRRERVMFEDYEKALFETEEFKKVLEKLPESEREKTMASLREFARKFYQGCIKPVENL